MIITPVLSPYNPITQPKPFQIPIKRIVSDQVDKSVLVLVCLIIPQHILALFALQLELHLDPLLLAVYPLLYHLQLLGAGILYLLSIVSLLCLHVRDHHRVWVVFTVHDLFADVCVLVLLLVFVADRGEAPWTDKR